MTPETRLSFNPRVSVFRHNGGIYLFDPATRTYASMNESMLAYFTKPDDTKSFAELSENDRRGLTEIAEQLHKLGILISPEFTDPYDWKNTPGLSGSLSNLAIFVTTKCNLKCSYCYAHGGDLRQTINRNIWKPAMEYYFSILNSTKAIAHVNQKRVNLSIHGGGEPTVEFKTLKEIVADFCEHAHAAGLKPSVGMGTNGTFNDLVFRWIIENNINVNISLDGPRDIQNLQRPFRSGKPSYDAVVSNLKALVKAGRRVSVRATITEDAVDSMPGTIELAKQLGITAVHFEPVSISGRCAFTSLSRPAAEHFANRFLECFILGLKYDIVVKYSGMRCFEQNSQRFCAACGRNLCVTPDGNITTCYEVLDPTDPASDEFFIGKIDPVRGLAVLDKTRITKLQHRIADNMDACNGCFLRYQCAGDCPVKSFRFSNLNLYTPDPYRCQISERINKQLIAWLADGVIETHDAKNTSVFSLNHNLI